LKLAPESPKGEKMEKDGGSGGRCEPHGQWWERWEWWEGWEWCGRAWEIAPEPPKGDKLQVEG